MRQRTPEDDLDLPPLDGDTHGDADEQGTGAHEHDEDLDESATRDTPDALDDATGEDDAHDEELDETDGEVWNEADETKPVDIGVFDISLGEEIPAIQVLGDDEGESTTPADEELGGEEETASGDGGEEGPLADDEELREEDLPELDADDDGEVDDASLYEGASIGIGPDEELRWADRAWARVGQTRLPPGAEPIVEPDGDDSGMLAVPGDDPKLAARDAAWRRFEESGVITAATFLPGDSVIIALEGPDRPQLVRIQPDGVARIIAEIEGSADDEGPETRVTALRWDAARGSLVATGTFGAQAFRPV